MKVKDVLALAAANLGREDLEAAVRDHTGEPAGELASLLRCYNLVENEIALDYYPLKAEESFTPGGDGRISYSSFAYAPVSVTGVTGTCGPVRYETFPSYLKLPDAREGESVTVSYTYSPAQKEWEDDSAFSEKISARLLSFGVACEFCLSRGQFSEAAMWDNKYREALKAANIIRKKLAVRSRRWV